MGLGQILYQSPLIGLVVFGDYPELAGLDLGEGFWVQRTYHSAIFYFIVQILQYWLRVFQSRLHVSDCRSQLLVVVEA